MTKYFAKKGFLHGKNDAEIIGQEFEKIVQEYGCLTPEKVVSEACNPKNKLHKYFKWDDEQAGRLYRLAQARNLINSISVVIKYDGKKVEHSAFFGINKKFQNKQQHIYLSINRIMSDADDRKQIIAQALRELKYWREKYGNLNELKTIFEKVDLILSKQKIRNQG